MTCAGLDNYVNATIGQLLAYPTTCDTQFYAKIMGGLWLIITLILFFKERERDVKPDFLSSAGVSALAIIIISLVGTLLTIISTEVFLEIMVLGGVFVVIWMIRDN